ncbi:MBL fold metallo-hydrolase [Streptomyces griseolus]|uniref:MBL fold metallo-hydrolase n=1 Tax=Streptomyces griseolus TaxID=1909 RepID=UPI0039089D9C
MIRGEEIAGPVLPVRERPSHAHALTGPRRGRSGSATRWRTVTGTEDGEELPFGGARVVHRPGHTPGAVAVRLPRHGVLFTGDRVAGADEVLLGVLAVGRTRAEGSFRGPAAPAPAVACFGPGGPLGTGAAFVLRAAAG